MSNKETHEPPSTKSDEMGGDGWLTLLLSTFLVFLFAGLTLGWQLIVVVRQMHLAKASCNGQAGTLLVPCMRLLNDQPGPDFLQRLERAHWHHQMLGSQILLMGGLTGDSSLSEAASGSHYLQQKEVPKESIMLEDQSRNTLENLRNARQKLKADNISQYTLITNRYHLARCKTLANGLNMFPQLCAAEEQPSYPPTLWPRLLMEAFYLHWYHTGKLWSRLTGNQHSLSRIH